MLHNTIELAWKVNVKLIATKFLNVRLAMMLDVDTTGKSDRAGKSPRSGPIIKVTGRINFLRRNLLFWNSFFKRISSNVLFQRRAK